MAWIDDLDTDVRPRKLGFVDALGSALDRFSMLDPTYADRRRQEREQRRREQLLPYELERVSLANQTARSALDELARDRRERAASPGSMQRVGEAAAPREAIVEWGEEEGAGVTRTQAGRPAARTVNDLTGRGVTWEDIERAATYKPNAFKELGLLSPEAAEEKSAVAAQRKEREALLKEAQGLDPKAPDFRERAYDLAARAALVERKPDAYLKAIMRTDDPVATLERLRGTLRGEGGPSDDTDRIDFEIGPDGGVRIKSKEPRQPSQSATYLKAVEDLEAAEDDFERNPTPENKQKVDKLKTRVDRLKSYPLTEGGVVVGAGSRKPIAEGPPKTQPLPAGQAENLADSRALVAQLDEAEKIFDPKYVGPVQGRWGAIKSMTTGTPERETELRTLVQSFKNQLLKARSGAAVTPQEYERISAELPGINDPDDVFLTKLRTARRLLKESIARREEEFAARGFRGGQGGAAAKDGKGADIRETLSRKNALYKKARDKGFSDQQIESQYGIRLTD